MVIDPSIHQGKQNSPADSQLHSQSVHPRKFLQALGKCDYHLLPVSSSSTLIKHYLVYLTSCGPRACFPSSLYFSNVRTQRRGAGGSLTSLSHTPFSWSFLISLWILQTCGSEITCSQAKGLPSRLTSWERELGMGVGVLWNSATLKERWQCLPFQLPNLRLPTKSRE